MIVFIVHESPSNKCSERTALLSYFADNNIWDLITGNNCTTLSEFITDFYASGFSFQSKLNLGSTLSRC